MTDIIVITTAVVVGLGLLAIVIFFGRQQWLARSRPGDNADVDGEADPGPGKPGMSAMTNSGDMLPGPGPTGYGAGGRMSD